MSPPLRSVRVRRHKRLCSVEYGATRVLVHEDAAYTDYLAEPAAHVLGGLVEQHKPDLLLIGTTYDGRDIAARLNMRLGSGVITDAAEIGYDGDQLKVSVPWFSASTIVDVTLTGATKLVLVRPKSFVAEKVAGATPRKSRRSTPVSPTAPSARASWKTLCKRAKARRWKKLPSWCRRARPKKRPRTLQSLPNWPVNSTPPSVPAVPSWMRDGCRIRIRWGRPARP